jgi:hypothetical protein
MCDVFVGPRVSAPSCVGPSVVSLASRSTASVAGPYGVTPPTPSARAAVTSAVSRSSSRAAEAQAVARVI